MAFEGPAVMVPGLVAGAGLTDTVSPSVQFKFVKLSADRTVVLVSAVTDKPIGVLQAPVKATGDPVTVMASGISKVRLAAASPVAGDIIGGDVDGQAASISIPTATSYQAGCLIEANASGAVASGVIGTALIDCIAPSRAA
jgi:hypothetical protein